MRNTNKNIFEKNFIIEHKSKLYDLIGSRIRAKRIELNMSEDELAKKLSITTKAVQNIENGKQKFTIDFLAKMSDILDINKVYLLTGVDNDVLKEDIQILNDYIEFFKIVQSLSGKNKERFYDLLDKNFTPNIKKYLKK